MKVENKSKKKFFTRKKIILSSLTSVLISVPVVTTVGVYGSTNGLNSETNERYLNDAVNYIKGNSKKINFDSGSNTKWEITVDGTTKTFDSSNSLMLFLYDEYITSYLCKTSINLKDKENEWGEILDKNIWENVYEATAKAATVYQGLNDVPYNTEEEAYDSYYTVRDGYYFNGIYFSSREDLKKYLIEVYLPNKTLNPTNNNTIILRGPNGVNSSPINLTHNDAMENVSRFIADNAIKTATYINSETGEALSLNDSNIDESVNKINIKDLDYLHVQSNEGEARYVVDNDLTDENNLIGPYFYKGSLDIGAFLNRDMWKMVRNVSDTVYVESKIDSMIGSFFTSIINDDSTLTLTEANESGKAPVLFRTLLVDSTGLSYDEWFLTELNKMAPSLFNAVTAANIELLKGKKYNTFYKIAILYSFMMQRIVSWGLGQNVLNFVSSYFEDICDFIQDAIELIIIDDSLLISSDGKTKFNMKDFFNIGNPEYDINSSIEHYMNRLKTEYPKFVAAMGAYIAAQNNVLSFGTLIPFESNDMGYLVEYSILSESELQEINPLLKNIYDVFSTINYDEMVVKYLKLSNDPKYNVIKGMAESEWSKEFDNIFSDLTGTSEGMILKGVGTKNSIYYNTAEAVLISEIQIYNETKSFVKYGYLNKLYSTNPLLNKLDLFIDFANKFQGQISLFRAYMAFLIDARMATSIFNVGNTKDLFEFSKAISRLVLLALGSVALVGNATKRIYNTGHDEENWLFDTTTMGKDGNDLTSLKHPNEAALLDANLDSKCYKYIEVTLKKDWFPDLVTDEIKDEDLVDSISFTAKEYNTDNDRFMLDQSKKSEKRSSKFCVTDSVNFYNILNSLKPNMDPKDRYDLVTNLDGVLVPNSTENIESNVQSRSSKMTRGRVEDFYPNISRYFADTFDIVSKLNTAGGIRTAAIFDAHIELAGLSSADARRYAQLLISGKISRDEALFNDPRVFWTKGGKPNPVIPIADWDDADRALIAQGKISHLPVKYKKPLTTMDPNNIWDSSLGNNGDDGTPDLDGGSSSNPRPIFTPDGDLNTIPQAPDDHTNVRNVDFTPDDTSSHHSGKGRRYTRWQTIKESMHNKVSGIPSSFRARFSELRDSATAKWSGIKSSPKLTTFSNVGKKFLKYSFQILGSVAMAMEFAFIIYELVKEVKTQDFYVFTAIDGTQWIWDGGLTSSKYFGMETKVIRDINDMILATPIMITAPNVEEIYYFDQIKYYDPKEMKKAAYKYILNGGLLPSSGAFTVSYTLFTEGYNASIMKANSIDELIKLAITDMGLVSNEDGSFDIKNLNKNSEFITTVSTSLANGVVVSPGDNYVTLAENISKKIRAAKLTILPDLVGGVANGKLTSEFVYPGKYWENGKIITPETSSYEGKILVDNSANQFKDNVQIPSYSYLDDSYFKVEDPKIAENQSTNSLYETFKKSFAIQSKQALPNEVIKHDFSNISSTMMNVTIYKITIDGEESIFVDEQSALNYLSKKLNINTVKTNDVYYVYGDKFFRDDYEIKEWVKAKSY